MQTLFASLFEGSTEHFVHLGLEASRYGILRPISSIDSLQLTARLQTVPSALKCNANVQEVWTISADRLLMQFTVDLLYHYKKKASTAKNAMPTVARTTCLLMSASDVIPPTSAVVD